MKKLQGSYCYYTPVYNTYFGSISYYYYYCTYYNDYYGGGGLPAKAIVGIIVGCLFLVISCLICCIKAARRNKQMAISRNAYVNINANNDLRGPQPHSAQSIPNSANQRLVV